MDYKIYSNYCGDIDADEKELHNSRVFRRLMIKYNPVKLTEKEFEEYVLSGKDIDSKVIYVAREIKALDQHKGLIDALYIMIVRRPKGMPQEYLALMAAGDLEYGYEYCPSNFENYGYEEFLIYKEKVANGR